MMNKRTVYYVVFHAPGLIVGDTWEQEVTGDDPRQVQWPPNAYCFDMYHRVDVIDGEDVYTGKPTKLGRYYHRDSKVETLEQVRRNPNATSVLIQNMIGNGCSHIIWSRWGTWAQPYDPKEIEIL